MSEPAIRSAEASTASAAWCRTFTAIPLPASLREALMPALAALRALPVRASWTVPEHLHVTLTFHGQHPWDRLTGFVPALRRALGRQTPFVADVRGLGAFGRPETPRVIWAGVAGQAAAWRDLYDCVAGVARASDLAIEPRPYHPHITLGRIRRVDPAVRSDLRRVRERWADHGFGSLTVDSVVLVRSELLTRGVRHTVLERFNLDSVSGQIVC